MKSIVTILALVLAVLVLGPVNSAQATDGKQLFADNKCGKCHEGTGTAPKVGAEIKAAMAKHADDASIIAFLKKQKANPAGKMHKKALTNSDADISAMITYLKTGS